MEFWLDDEMTSLPVDGSSFFPYEYIKMFCTVLYKSPAGGTWNGVFFFLVRLTDWLIVHKLCVATNAPREQVAAGAAAAATAESGYTGLNWEDEQQQRLLYQDLSSIEADLTCIFYGRLTEPNQDWN